MFLKKMETPPIMDPRKEQSFIERETNSMVRQKSPLVTLMWNQPLEIKSALGPWSYTSRTNRWSKICRIWESAWRDQIWSSVIFLLLDLKGLHLFKWKKGVVFQFERTNTLERCVRTFHLIFTGMSLGSIVFISKGSFGDEWRKHLQMSKISQF